MHNQPFSMQLKEPPLSSTVASMSEGGWSAAAAAPIMARRPTATLQACHAPMRVIEGVRLAAACATACSWQRLPHTACSLPSSHGSTVPSLQALQQRQLYVSLLRRLQPAWAMSSPHCSRPGTDRLEGA